jgi:hypothetical protein
MTRRWGLVRKIRFDGTIQHESFPEGSGCRPQSSASAGSGCCAGMYPVEWVFESWVLLGPLRPLRLAVYNVCGVVRDVKWALLLKDVAPFGIAIAALQAAL